MINFKNYKRFFAFGCSFTHYIWPTWADLIAVEMPDAEYNNLGIAGTGNISIACRIIEANRRFNFTSTDLIVVMWSTLCREDRWVNGHWKMTGNIFTQNEYDGSFVKKFADPKGYLITNMAIIDSTISYLRSTGAEFFTMQAVAFNHQQVLTDSQVTNILDLYQSSVTPSPSLLDVEFDGSWKIGHSYFKHNNVYDDWHPTPLNYYNFLKKINIDLSVKSHEYAMSSTRKLLSTKTENEILNSFDFSNRNMCRYQMF